MIHLTPTERAALDRLRDRREPSEIVRWQDRVYVRFHVEFYVLDGEGFVPFHGAFPNRALMTGVERVRWEDALDFSWTYAPGGEIVPETRLEVVAK